MTTTRPTYDELLARVAQLEQARSLEPTEALAAANGALRESQARLKAILLVASSWMWEVDQDGVYTFLSEKGLRCFGDDAVGKSAFDFMEPGEAERLQPFFLELVSRQAPIEDLENWNRRQDGTRICLLTNGVPIIDDHGRFKGYRGVDKDITERKELERRLREGQERFRLALRGADLGSWDWDIPSGQVSFDERWVGILGFDLDAFPPSLEAWQARVHPDELPAMNAALAAHLEGKTESFAAEYRMRHKSGRWIWVLDTGRVIERDPCGAPLRACGTQLDVTHRKVAEENQRKLESQLRHSQRMEAVGQLAGGIAHDFNNILAAMSLQLDVLRLRPDIGPEQLSQAVHELAESVDRAARLTRQLLLFSRRQTIQPTRQDVRVVVENLVTFLRRLLGETVTLAVERCDEPLWVEADLGMLEQVVTNLCLNARDAMPDGGRITIRTTSVSALEASKLHGEVPPGRFVRVEVVDSGCGMAPEVMEHLFEPFFTTKPPGKGSGLGLATVHGIVAQHHGLVEVASELGKGSIFQVYLPSVASEGDQAPRPGPIAALRGGSERILVVEDEAPVRRMAVRCLRNLGYRVSEAESAVKALEVWAQEGGRFDLLFTDLVMPDGLSGLELCRRLRALKPQLKTVIASGYAMQVIDEAVAAELEVKYLAKPYDVATLAATLRACFGPEK